MKVTFVDQTFDCIKAVRETDTAKLYLSVGGTVKFAGVSDWSAFSLEGGGWTDQEPSTEEVLLEIAADHEERLCMMELGI